MLLAAAVGCILLAGCRRPAPAHPQRTQVFVRLPALLSLHPAWAAVRELDVLIAHTAGLDKAGQSVATAGVPLPEVSLPPPLIAGSAPLTSRPPTIEGVTRAAAARLNRLRDSMDAHAERIVERERKEKMEKVAADVTAKRADLQAAAVNAPVESALSPEDLRELHKLQFREIALESQVAALLPPARGDADVKLKDVRKQIAAIESKAPKPGEELQAKIDKQVENYGKLRFAEMERNLSRRKAALQAESARRLDPYHKRLEERAVLPPPPTIPGSSAMSAMARRIASPSHVTSSAKSAAAPLPTGEAIARLRDQRQRLVRTITDELRTRLQAVGSARRWTLSLGPRPGYIDVTDQAAAALRSELDGETARAGNPK